MIEPERLRRTLMSKAASFTDGAATIWAEIAGTFPEGEQKEKALVMCRALQRCSSETKAVLMGQKDF